MGKLSWKPKRKGAIYCAPACGRGCTWAKYSKATHAALALARRLGSGWTTCVHENLGWHWSAVSPCGRIYVYSHSENFYSAYMNLPDSQPAGRWVASANTPGLAVIKVIRYAKEELADLQKLLRGL